MALSAFFGMDGEERSVGVDDIIWIVIETMETAICEEFAQFDAVEQGGCAEDAFPFIEFS